MKTKNIIRDNKYFIIDILILFFATEFAGYLTYSYLNSTLFFGITIFGLIIIALSIGYILFVIAYRNNHFIAVFLLGIFILSNLLVPIFYSSFPITIPCYQVEYGAYSAIQSNEITYHWINFAGQSQFIPMPYEFILPLSEIIMTSNYNFQVHYEHGQNATLFVKAYYMHTWNCNFKVIELTFINNTSDSK